RRDDAAPHARPEIVRLCIGTHHDTLGGDARPATRADDPAAGPTRKVRRPGPAVNRRTSRKRGLREPTHVSQRLNGAGAPVDPAREVLVGAEVTVRFGL